MGALLSPLIATSLIARAGWPWHRFYYLSLALACINTVFSRLAFAPDANERKGALDAAMATRSIQLDSLAGRSGRVGDEEGSAETSVDEQDESEVAKVSSLEAGSALGGEALPALNGREHDGLSLSFFLILLTLASGITPELIRVTSFFVALPSCFL
jgi:hypothetical protein